MFDVPCTRPATFPQRRETSSASPKGRHPIEGRSFLRARAPGPQLGHRPARHRVRPRKPRPTPRPTTRPTTLQLFLNLLHMGRKKLHSGGSRNSRFHTSCASTLKKTEDVQSLEKVECWASNDLGTSYAFLQFENGSVIEP